MKRIVFWKNVNRINPNIYTKKLYWRIELRQQTDDLLNYKNEYLGGYLIPQQIIDRLMALKKKNNIV